MAGDDDGLANAQAYFTQSTEQQQQPANQEPQQQPPPTQAQQNQHEGPNEEQQYLGLNHNDQGKIKLIFYENKKSKKLTRVVRVRYTGGYTPDGRERVRRLLYRDEIGITQSVFDLSVISPLTPLGYAYEKLTSFSLA